MLAWRAAKRGAPEAVAKPLVLCGDNSHPPRVVVRKTTTILGISTPREDIEERKGVGHGMRRIAIEVANETQSGCRYLWRPTMKQTRDARVGQRQAELYANCLEKQIG